MSIAMIVIHENGRQMWHNTVHSIKEAFSCLQTVTLRDFSLCGYFKFTCVQRSAEVIRYARESYLPSCNGNNS